jgi:hypothetical protein
MRILLLLAVGLGACAKDFAYQNTNWGMNEKSVRSARGSEYESTFINGQKAAVSYSYGPKGLRGVRVVFEPVHMEKEKYIDLYHQVKALLTEKYRAPELEAADFVAKAEKHRISAEKDYESASVFRAGFLQATLTCPGNCDGTSPADSITLLYEPPGSRTDAL